MVRMRISPTSTMCSPSSRPFSCWMVYRSVSTWVGGSPQPSPALITGTLARRGAGAGRVEGGDQDLFRQQIAVAPVTSDRRQAVGHFKDPIELLPFKSFERQDVSSGKTAHRVSSSSSMVHGIGGSIRPPTWKRKDPRRK